MVDILALAISHGLLALAVLRLLARGDLYDESGDEPKVRAHRPARLRKSDRDA